MAAFPEAPVTAVMLVLASIEAVIVAHLKVHFVMLRLVGRHSFRDLCRPVRLLAEAVAAGCRRCYLRGGRGQFEEQGDHQRDHQKLLL